jgi:menaquinone-9 beta-reductase
MVLAIPLVIKHTAIGAKHMIYDAIIVGAGLAGCSAAIQLADQGWNILLLEQQRYPAHKLCGEFLSIEVLGIFEQLGILDQVVRSGAQPINQALVTTAGGASFTRTLPGTALGLSRYQLDLMLFERAIAVGATAYDGTIVKAMTGDFASGFQVQTSRGTFQSRTVLAAYGKRSALDTQRDRPFTRKPSPWVGFKAHCSGLELPGMIELHAFTGGYCGLSAIETGQINLCWIGHESVLQSGGDQNLPAALYANPVLRDRLAHLKFDRTVQHRLRQISFALKGNFDGDICLIGDTAGMITPLCGDGMAMALRTAEMVVPLVSNYLQNPCTETQWQREYQRQWQREFTARLQLGRLLHSGFIRPPIAQASVVLCQQFPAIGDWLIRHTRGEARRVAVAAGNATPRRITTMLPGQIPDPVG